MAERPNAANVQECAVDGEGSDSRAGEVMEEGVANGEPVGDYIHLIAAVRTGVRKTRQLRNRGVTASRDLPEAAV